MPTDQTKINRLTMKVETKRLDSITEALYNLLTDAIHELRGVRWDDDDSESPFTVMYGHYTAMTETQNGQLVLVLDPYSLDDEIKTNFLSVEETLKINYTKFLNHKVSVLKNEVEKVEKSLSLLKTDVASGVVKANKLIYDSMKYRSDVSSFIYSVEDVLHLVERVERSVSENINVFGTSISNTPTEPAEPGVKLKWNGTSDSLYDLFAQLSLVNVKANKPLLENTLEEIARFLADHIEGMPSVETIDRRIREFRNPDSVPPKRGRIVLDITKGNL